MLVSNLVYVNFPHSELVLFCSGFINMMLQEMDNENVRMTGGGERKVCRRQKKAF